MAVLQGSRKNKKSDSLYKIGDLANISKISLQNNGSFLEKTKEKYKEEEAIKKEEEGQRNNQNKKAAASVQRRPTFSSSHLHIRLEKKEKKEELKKGSKTRVPSLQCHLLKFRVGGLGGWFPDLLPAVRRRRNEGRGRPRPRRP